MHDVGMPRSFDKREAQAGGQVKVVGRLGLIHGVLRKGGANKSGRTSARAAETQNAHGVHGSRSLSSGL